MSDFHAGFFIARTDSRVAEPVRAAILNYLQGTDQSPDEVDQLVWIGREGLDALLVIATINEQVAGRANVDWVFENIHLGAHLARVTGARVWAYTFNNQAGHESLVTFDSQGTILGEEHTSWDDPKARALDALAGELNVPRALIEYDLIYGTESFGGPIVTPVDEAGFARYLAGRRPVIRPKSDRPAMMYYMPTAMADELDHCATQLDVDLDDIFDSVWEVAKVELHRTVPTMEFDDPEAPPSYLPPPPPSEPPLELPREAPKAPPLAASSEKVGVRLALSPITSREVRELAMAADRSLSWVIQKAYLRGRDHLLETVRLASE